VKVINKLRKYPKTGKVTEKKTEKVTDFLLKFKLELGFQMPVTKKS